jgi:hypothetical protein
VEVGLVVMGSGNWRWIVVAIEGCIWVWVVVAVGDGIWRWVAVALGR